MIRFGGRRNEGMKSNINNQLKIKVNYFKLFSVAFDELTDVTNNAPLVLFIQGVNAKFEVTVELASVNSLNEQTIS